MQRVVLVGSTICLLCLGPILVQAAPEKENNPAAKSPAAKANPPAAEKTTAEETKAKKAPVKAAKKKAEKPKKPMVVQFTIKGSYPEGPVPAGLFGDLQQSLATLIRRMDQAAEDKEVAAVLLRIESLQFGRGKLNELRAAVVRLRKAGKPVYAELTAGDGRQYLLAAACNEIFTPPSGMLMITGVRAEVTFYKGLLEKLGIQADMIQMGKYKGAAEPFTRTGMSPALRENIESLVDDNFDQMVADIAKDRKLKGDQVKALIDRGIFTAAAAHKARLIDHVVYADEFLETLRKKLKADELNIVTKYKKKRVDMDFSGFSGMMKLMELMLGGKPTSKTTQQKKIALVYAVGPIIPGNSTTGIFGEQAVGSTTLVKAIRTAADNPKVLAIVLRVDSPGGSAIASDLIWREVVRIKKPIIASMGDVAGSGGYYIVMGADEILAEPATVTGSIGVVGGKLALGGLYDKVGLTTEVISRGKLSGTLSSNQPFTPEERKAWTATLREVYGQFVAKAAQGRDMSVEKLEKLAQGRVYTGRMALASGLVDGLGTLRDAIAEAKKAAKLKPDEKVELLILPRPKTIFEQLFGDPAASVRLKAVTADLAVLLSQADLLRRLFAEPALTLMPYRLKLK